MPRAFPLAENSFKVEVEGVEGGSRERGFEGCKVGGVGRRRGSRG